MSSRNGHARGRCNARCMPCYDSTAAAQQQTYCGLLQRIDQLPPRPKADHATAPTARTAQASAAARATPSPPPAPPCPAPPRQRHRATLTSIAAAAGVAREQATLQQHGIPAALTEAVSTACAAQQAAAPGTEDVDWGGLEPTRCRKKWIAELGAAREFFSAHQRAPKQASDASKEELRLVVWLRNARYNLPAIKDPAERRWREALLNSLPFKAEKQPVRAAAAWQIVSLKGSRSHNNKQRCQKLVAPARAPDARI